MAYLTGVQLKKFVEYSAGDEITPDDLGDDTEGLDDLELDAADVSNQEGPAV